MYPSIHQPSCWSESHPVPVHCCQPGASTETPNQPKKVNVEIFKLTKQVDTFYLHWFFCLSHTHVDKEMMKFTRPLQAITCEGQEGLGWRSSCMEAKVRFVKLIDRWRCIMFQYGLSLTTDMLTNRWLLSEYDDYVIFLISFSIKSIFKW